MTTFRLTRPAPRRPRRDRLQRLAHPPRQMWQSSRPRVPRLDCALWPRRELMEWHNRTMRPQCIPPPANRARAPSVHDCVKLTPVKDPLRDTRGNAHDGDACSVLNQKNEDGAAHGYHPRRGGRYDCKEDRSPSPEPPGTRVVSREISAAPFPPRFR